MHRNFLLVDADRGYYIYNAAAPGSWNEILMNIMIERERQYKRCWDTMYLSLEEQNKEDPILTNNNLRFNIWFETLTLKI